MVWLQKLAGRAEDLLNKIDQNAATVLKESNLKVKEVEEQIQEGSENLELRVRNYTLKEGVSILDPQSTDTNSDFGIVFDVVSEKQKCANESVCGENVLDNSTKSSTKSVQMSTPSSLHNNFFIAEDSQLLNEKLTRSELKNQELNKQLLNMQHLYSELRNENANLQFQIERYTEQFVQAQIEKDRYTARAQRILQEKERLIAFKQENNFDKGAQDIDAAYNEDLKKELEVCQENNNELILKNNQLEKEIHSLQMEYKIIENGLQQSSQNLETKLMSEKNCRLTAEEDCIQKNKELDLKNQELCQLQDLLKSKNSELSQLKKIMKKKSTVDVDDDAETRIKSLTQTLMLKQHNLETITTERNALRIQLEKLENEHKKNLAHLKKSQVKVVNVQEADEPLLIPRFTRVSPFDAAVTRRVKRAYSTLDDISIRTGIFLRCYPLARVFVLCYMVLLHIWVLIILFVYAPSNS